MRKLYNWLLLTFHTVMLNISIALYNVENSILKADPNNLGENNKKTQRMRHRNPVLEKFYAGQTDEKYVQEFYEILKGADKFMRNATPHKMAVAADKFGMNYGKADIYGRVHEHYGFFDEKSKNSGKTVAEVTAIEKMSRKTNDDDYVLENIYSNIPIEVGFVKAIDSIGADIKHVFVVEDFIRNSNQFEFPMNVYRENGDNPLNKIEHVTEYVHVKKIGFEFVQLEFFIPSKFKTKDLEPDSDIMKDLLNFNQIFFKDPYGEINGFTVTEFKKKIEFGEFEVFKFNGIRMQTINNIN